ncbi:MAG: signal peptidase I [Bacteroides sp.]|nr:signal peptidase I [Bacteroides sp.]
MWDEEKDKSETMEAVDLSKIESDGGGYFKHREEDGSDTMDAIDPDEYKKLLEGSDKKTFEEELSPIEVKSTRHLELQQREEEKKEAVENAHTAANEVFDWLESILTAVIAIVLIFTFIIRINTVDGDSMNPTLTAGQKLVVSDLFYTPAYNDIVIVQAARLDGGKPIVKRIIGLPGDTIRIDFESGTVYRNNTALPLETKDGILYEDGHPINTVTTLRQDMQSNVDYTVPEGSYFVMGDNRNNSKDSRLLSVIGFIDKNYIAGRAVFSIFPFDTFGFTE